MAAISAPSQSNPDNSEKTSPTNQPPTSSAPSALTMQIPNFPQGTGRGRGRRGKTTMDVPSIYLARLRAKRAASALPVTEPGADQEGSSSSDTTISNDAATPINPDAPSSKTVSPPSPVVNAPITSDLVIDTVVENDPEEIHKVVTRKRKIPSKKKVSPAEPKKPSKQSSTQRKKKKISASNSPSKDSATIRAAPTLTSSEQPHVGSSVTSLDLGQPCSYPIFKKWKGDDIEAAALKMNIPVTTRNECIRLIRGISFRSGRRFNPVWYDSSPAFSFFKEIVESQGWAKFLAHEHPLLPLEVAQFYATVTVSNDFTRLEATVNGHQLTLSRADIGHLLEIPATGYDLLPDSVWPALQNPSSLQIVQHFIPHATQPSTFETSILSVQKHLLLNLIQKTLTPSSDRSKCSISDIILIYFLEHHLPINLPALIIHSISDARKLVQSNSYTSNSRLPFGMWLSRIFVAKNLVSSVSLGISGMTNDMRSSENMKRMGIILDNDQLWSLKEYLEHSAKTAATGGSSLPSSSSSHLPLPSLDSIRTIIREEVDTAITGLSNRLLGEMRLHLQTILGQFAYLGVPPSSTKSDASDSDDPSPH